MHQRDIRSLRILEEIEKNASPTQRELASRLNISLGLVNSFIRRLVRKGYLKIGKVSRNRIRYILTTRGFSEKSRLTYESIQHSFYFYKTARNKLKAVLEDLERQGVRRIIFYGAGDLAEIAYISLQETSLKMVATVDEFKSGERFLGHTIRHPSELDSMNYDKIIVTSIDSASAVYESLLRQAVPQPQILRLE